MRYLVFVFVVMFCIQTINAQESVIEKETVVHEAVSQTVSQAYVEMRSFKPVCVKTTEMVPVTRLEPVTKMEEVTTYKTVCVETVQQVPVVPMMTVPVMMTVRTYSDCSCGKNCQCDRKLVRNTLKRTTAKVKSLVKVPANLMKSNNNCNCGGNCTTVVNNFVSSRNILDNCDNCSKVIKTRSRTVVR